MRAPRRAPLERSNVIAFIADIFERRGAEAYLGEAVTMAQHMLQAAHGAEQAGADEATVAAALLHDLGHFTNEFPEDALDRDIDNRHDAAGAAVLAPFFPALVTRCVREHVNAKRYLCVVEPGYFERLSPASVHTLRLQGGPMSESETRRFAALPERDAIVCVRRFDEAAKVPGARTPPFAHYVPLLERLLETHGAS